jgi:hypothetical protein
MGVGKSAENVIQDREILTSKYGPGNGAVEAKPSEEEIALEKKLLRKIDLLIMPLIVVIYLMNFIDR